MSVQSGIFAEQPVGVPPTGLKRLARVAGVFYCDRRVHRRRSSWWNHVDAGDPNRDDDEDHQGPREALDGVYFTPPDLLTPTNGLGCSPVPLTRAGTGLARFPAATAPNGSPRLVVHTE